MSRACSKFKIRKDCRKIISIAKDLLGSLESTVHVVQPVRPPKPPQFEVNPRLSSSHAGSSEDLARADAEGVAAPGTSRGASSMPPLSEDANVNMSEPIVEEIDDQALPPLDYSALKEEMEEAYDRERALILQALKWRLTQGDAERRERVMSDFVTNDILGCANAGSYRDSVMKMLETGSYVLKQYLARFYYAIACFRDGRDYLGSYLNYLPALLKTPINKGMPKDYVAEGMVFASLQKLGVRRQLQSVMIEQGVIEWMVDQLENTEAMNDNTLQFCVALLKKLCLRTLGKKRCLPTPTANRTLSVVSSLLFHENKKIRPDVTAILYSILSVPAIRREAAKMEEIAQRFNRLKNDPAMKEEMGFLSRQLSSDEDHVGFESDDEDGIEDEGELGEPLVPYLINRELVQPFPGGLDGEALLTSMFTLSRPQGASRGMSGRMRPRCEGPTFSESTLLDEALNLLGPDLPDIGYDMLPGLTINMPAVVKAYTSEPLMRTRPAVHFSDFPREGPITPDPRMAPDYPVDEELMRLKQKKRRALARLVTKRSSNPEGSQVQSRERCCPECKQSIQPSDSEDTEDELELERVKQEYWWAFKTRPKIPRTPDCPTDTNPPTPGPQKDAARQTLSVPQRSTEPDHPPPSDKSAPGSPQTKQEDEPSPALL